ncbi:MAG: hypothetical protein ROZ37_04180 [Aromatoleum sp.]|jgi:hypothetical protein|uniref:hypothetical protein n=1 Tax=Aromatoleum sp. TaxID=2307007 RepID=UPI0028940A30|nr:hypothetical protein [Aromatoleum sp.]MDT3669517.1 hypothetical protein [Aromatoleum sp.]
MQDTYVGVNDQGLRIGKYHQNCRHSDEMVDRVRALREDEGLTYAEISAATGVPKGTIASICRYDRRGQAYTRWKRITPSAP